MKSSDKGPKPGQILYYITLSIMIGAFAVLVGTWL